MAVPRLAPFDGDGVALPQPLATPDAVVLRRLFDATHLPMPDLLRAAARLDPSLRLNQDMLGHLLASRYLAGGRHATAAQLSAWLDRYSALSDAPAIAAVFARTAPRSAVPATPPPPALDAAADEAESTQPSLMRRNPGIDTSLAQLLDRGQFDRANRLVARSRGLAPAYRATLLAEIAQTLFTHNRDAEALALARQAVTEGRRMIGLADYVAGLAAWRLDDPHAALTHFAAAARAPIATPGLHAAGAYWAARACIAIGDPVRGRVWLDQAATQRHAFYGLIAARMIGGSEGLDVTRAVLGEADVAAVAAEPAGLRAFALLQIGQTTRAESELRLLAAERPPLTRSIMLIAERACLFDLVAALESNRFAVPRLLPRHGFLMDPALVYALTRVESNFDAAAVSPVGAEGLMQLMPQTAGAMVHGAPRLHDPSVNLDLGQRYLAYLADHGAVEGDLIRLLASYNAGPASFAAWRPTMRDFNDPLLLIETIPVAQTRLFVQRTLAYTWIYADRLNLPAPSLDALAAGRYPRFSDDTPRIDLATLH